VQCCGRGESNGKWRRARGCRQLCLLALGAEVSIACGPGGADDDIISKQGKAREVFAKLKVVWRSSIQGKSTKIRIFKSNVIAVLYGCQSWRMTKVDEAKLDTFHHKCLRGLLKTCW